MFEQLIACVVHGGHGGVGLQGAGGEFVGEVFPRVEVFEHAGDGFEVFGLEVDGCVWGGGGGRYSGGEERGLEKEGTVGAEVGGCRGGAHAEAYDGGFEVA